MTAHPPLQAHFTRKDWAFLSVVSACGLLVGLEGIINYGYIGQDFTSHRTLILSFPDSFNFSLTNPPGLYWFGSLVRRLAGPAHYLEVIASSFLLLNASALWIIYRFLWMSITRWQLRFAAAALSTFIPFRLIHSVVLAADALTLPLFALAALFTLRLFRDPRSPADWSALSLSLLVGMLCKYTVAGLLPPIALLLGVAVWRRVSSGKRLRWAAMGVLALALPAGVFLYEMHESSKVTGSVTNQQWLANDAPSVMRWRDMLTFQESDLGILRAAPEYMRDKMYGLRSYSYLGLIHASAFTDVLNFFQPPPPDIPADWGHRTQEPFPRHRTALSQTLQNGSVRVCLVFSALAVAGTLFSIVLSFQSLFSRAPLCPDAAIVMTALAVGFYSTVFFSLHRLGDPYTAGFWLPRLVLPAVLVFFSLGFFLVDFVCGHLGKGHRILRPFLFLTMGYSFAACLLFAGFLL